MIEDALTYQEPRRIASDVVIVGSGLSALAVASRIVGHQKRIVILEAGGETSDRDLQRDLWGGTASAANGPLRDSHPEPHIGRVRVMGGASTVWGGRCTPLLPEDMAGRTDGSPGWPIGFDEIARYMPATCEFLQTGAHDYTLEGSASEGANRPFLAPADDPRVVEGIERFSLPANAARHFRETLLARDDVTLILNATVTEILSDENGTRAAGVRARTAGGLEIEAFADVSVVATGGIEAPRLLLSSRPAALDHALGNHHDQVGRYYQTHIWGQVGQFIIDRKVARRVSYAERSSDDIYFKRNLLLSVEERRRLGVLAMCLRPSMGNLADPALRVPSYSLIYLMRRFLNPELRRHVEQYADAHEMSPAQLAAGHIANLLLGLPQLSLFLARYTRRRLWAERRQPGLTEYHRNGIYGVEFSAEQAANPESRVTLGSKRDALGMARVRIDWRLTDLDRHTVGASLRAFRECLQHRRAAAIRLSDDEIEETVRALRPAKGHHMGTTRMSATPAEGVVDRDAQVWGVRGLYVAGSSVFTTCGYSNPTMPAVALSLRLGDHIARKLGVNEYTV